MLSFIKEEKKVEYLELIYDLVFVYMIGRNNAFLGHIENGFVSANAFIAYVLCTLAIIQIWSFTTFYINMFGRNGVRDHVFLCVNMYLMFYVGQATRLDWSNYQMQYHIAWALILINIGVQYVIELRNHQMDVWNRDTIKRMAVTLFAESALALSAAFVPENLVAPISFGAIGLGMLLTSIVNRKSPGKTVDFAHLTERAMLYVVFTFGEMIIEISSYFVSDGSFSWNVIYYSLMGFLIVVGLFMSYEMIYDHLLDRDRHDNGMIYMLIHIFIIFGLNNITASLEFMREEEVALIPKMIFMVVSVIIYYGFLFSIGKYAKKTCRIDTPFILRLTAATAGFALLMMLFRETSAAHILITVVYVWSIFGVLWRAAKMVNQEELAAREAASA